MTSSAESSTPSNIVSVKPPVITSSIANCSNETQSAEILIVPRDSVSVTVRVQEVKNERHDWKFKPRSKR